MKDNQNNIQLELFNTSNSEENEKAKQSDTTSQETLNSLFNRLSKSTFRSKFHLTAKDKTYIHEKGLDTIQKHAEDFITKRLAPAKIPNDGKQTPMRGHPIFLAQHATACCCRGCLNKWHNIPPGRALTNREQEYIVGVLMEWIKRQDQ